MEFSSSGISQKACRNYLRFLIKGVEIQLLD